LRLNSASCHSASARRSPSLRVNTSSEQEKQQQQQQQPQTNEAT
jgi:hypothetical protein